MRTRMLDYLARESYKPLKLDALADALKVSPADFEELCDVLNQLESEGLVVVNRKGRIGLTHQMGLFAGTIEGHTKGYAFFIPDDGNRNDIFIGYDYLGGALHRDRVLVRVTKEHKYVNSRDEGEVVRVLQRVNHQIVGVFEEGKMWGFVKPDDRRLFQDVLISSKDQLGAKDGDRVVVEYTAWPTSHRSPEGKVVEVLGPKDAANIDMLAVIRKHGLPEKFPAKVEQNGNDVASIEAADYDHRRDFRAEQIVTIDGDDARDLDDAISLTRLANHHFRLGVHIADVAHYVKKGSPLDREAWSRGTSVYLPDRVIPMLPTSLSNNICSLHPAVGRLTLSCVMEVDRKGNVVDYEIAESVIHSKARMTYDDVNAILEGDETLRAQYGDFLELFEGLDELREILLRKREKRGALTFDFPEAKVICDDEGNVLELRRREHGRAESIIEECMILANETVAGEYFHRDLPFIYRIHERPSDEKLLDLREVLGPLGYRLKGNLDELQPMAFQQLLNEVGDRPESYLLQMSVLRAMSHARYDTENWGHFGLASPCYCHFTSPIRRYPDLADHRLIKEFLKRPTLGEGKGERLYKNLTEASNQSSLREQIAEEAEREAVDIKKARYMAEHIGEEYDGIIASVVAFGFFVELENTVNGLVHVSSLEDDFYEYHDTRRYLLGLHGGRRFCLGDPVRVRVMRVNIEEHLIDFELVEGE